MKNIILTIVCLFCLAQGWAGPIVFGDVRSDIAAEFLTKVKDAAEQDQVFTWADTDVFSVIQITDQGTVNLSDGTRNLLTVSLGFSEDDDKPVVLTTGSFYMYAPLKTIVLLLDDSRAEESLAEAFTTLNNESDYLTGEFHKLYETGHNASLEAMVESELSNYSAMVAQWFMTPRAQGGAGSSVSGLTRDDLADFLGFDSENYSYFSGNDCVFSIVKLSSEGVTLAGTPLGDSYSEGPLFFAEIKFPSCSARTYRNPSYEEK